MNSYSERIKEASEFGRAMAQKVMELGGGIGNAAKYVSNKIPVEVGIPLAGAALGGGGMALYDWARGTKKNRLTRALAGAGLGGLAGLGVNEYRDYKGEQAELEKNRKETSKRLLMREIEDNIKANGGSQADVDTHLRTLGFFR